MALDAGWRTVTLVLYGRKMTLSVKSVKSVKTRVVLLRSLGVKARLVAVKWDRKAKKGPSKTVFLFSTDTALTPEEVSVTSFL